MSCRHIPSVHRSLSAVMAAPFLFIIWTASSGMPATVSAAEPPDRVTQAMIERDWMRQAELRVNGGVTTPTVVQDAAGAVDGVIDGKWGFHTQNEVNPWWQVDLGRNIELEQVVLFNRCDQTAGRNRHIQLLLSVDGTEFQPVYEHNGETFGGFSDKRPLRIPLALKPARFVRLQLEGTSYLHLDEVQVISGGKNVALHRPASQSSVSQWSKRHGSDGSAIAWPTVLADTIARGQRLANHLAAVGIDTSSAGRILEESQRRLTETPAIETDSDWKSLYFQVRRAVRQLAFANPLLDFDRILFVKRRPTAFPHISDQFYGWWSRAGGGLYLLENYRSGQGTARCLTGKWPRGNFLRPDISCDGKRVLFAYSQEREGTHDIRNKRDKRNLSAGTFYHMYELDLQSDRVRQVTRGKYDDFDGRYLPNGELVFLSTRKGQFLQTTAEQTRQTLTQDLPDSYVRCGGDDYRPVPVFTLHVTDVSGKSIRPISAFETFEYTPSVAADGRILYCRWDYIDRFNGHFFSLWSTNPDGTNPQLVYGNLTKQPQATLEARSIPGSGKLLFTAAAHHAITGGSLVLLDPARGYEGAEPLERITPEVPFPEAERNVGMYYANPWPLSEDFYLVSWSDRRLPPHSRVEDNENNPGDAQGIYLYDRFGNLELLYRDSAISSMTPIPVRRRPSPPIVSSQLATTQAIDRGKMLVQDVYRGLSDVPRGSVKHIRVVGVVPKVQPRMNQPSLGVSREETGKFVLGTVPVEADGSACFLVPSGLPLFFQLLDEEGFAVQTMRSLTYVQAGQTFSCVGCHEPRQTAPATRPVLALDRPPSAIQLDVPGTWPLDFDALVQPVLDKHCVACHRTGSSDAEAAGLDLQSENAWSALIGYAENNLKQLVFEKDVSEPGFSPARESKLYQYLQTDERHRGLPLSDQDRRRLIAWMDLYGQTSGSFSSDQQQQLEQLRRQLHASN